MDLLEEYVETVIAFSPEAFDAAHEQGVGEEDTPEWSLTQKAHNRISELKEEDGDIDAVLVMPGRIIILHSNQYYETIRQR